MGWKNSYEMAAVMILPVIPFLCLVWFDVTKSAQCGAYCLVAIAAMLGLMLYRRDEYSMKMAPPVARPWQPKRPVASAGGRADSQTLLRVLLPHES